MKKTNKILGGLFAVLLVGTLTTKAVKAETLDGLGSEGKDATVQTVLESDVYSVDIKWGSMRFTFEKVSDDNYRWIPQNDGYRTSNYVEITNNSTKDIKASMSWNETISGVNSRFTYTSKTQGKGTCIALDGIGDSSIWSDEGLEGGYRMDSNKENVLYSDATCETYVESGSAYSNSATYYMVSLDYTDPAYIASTTISAPILYENAPFTVAGFYNTRMGRLLPTTGIFEMSLYGGNTNDVKTAYNSETKKIGTVTVTITDAE